MDGKVVAELAKSDLTRFDKLRLKKVELLKYKAADGQTRGGTFAIAVDPVNQGTVYAGTLLSKVWKSTDCGATWNAVATGTNAMDVNRGMNWTLAVDPADPTHFTIPVTTNGTQSVLDGWLRDDNTVRLKPRGGYYIERRYDDWTWAPDGSKWSKWVTPQVIKIVPNHGQDPP